MKPTDGAKRPKDKKEKPFVPLQGNKILDDVVKKLSKRPIQSVLDEQQNPRLCECGHAEAIHGNRGLCSSPECSERVCAPGFKAAKPPKHAGGRPTMTTKDLPSDWKEKIIEMSLEGMSDVEIRAKLCVKNKKFSHDLWYALKAREPEFAETLQIGKVLCQAWWEEQGRKIDHLMHEKGRVFETGLWYANMKNRFGWRDKTEIEHDLPDEAYQKLKGMSVDELMKKAAELAGKK